MTGTVLAVGAGLKNTACLWLHGEAHWSPLHGDLTDPQACTALQQSVRTLVQRAHAAGAPVQAVAHDLHPDFFSTRLAWATADALGVPALGVQHHHAHLAATVAAHGVSTPVAGVALDGVGLGTDGRPWGGELLWLDGAQCERLGHLQPLALPGGDQAAREPWRMAASVLHSLDRAGEIVPRFGAAVGHRVAAGIQQMLARQLNCPLTSSAGRWFDAAAAALGLCLVQHAEADAAMALERAAARALAPTPHIPPIPGALHHPDGRIDLRPVLAPLFDAPDADIAAAGFHLAVADALVQALVQTARARGTRQAVLGGGCFFNRILRERLQQRLLHEGLAVYLPGPQGCGDAGLALGQAWVASQWLKSGPSADPAPLRLEVPQCA